MKKNASMGIGRRQFIQVSSAAAAGTILLGPTMLATPAIQAPTRLAVGFVDWISDTAAIRLDVLPGAKVWGSDGAFLRHDAQITIVSASRSSAGSQVRRAVALNANFSYFEGAEERVAPFFAWTYDPKSRSSSNRSSFRIPLDTQQSIRLVVGLKSASSPSSSRRRAAGGSSAASNSALPFTLSLRDEPGSYRLARGFYILVPLLDGESDPTWSSYVFAFRAGQWGLYERGSAHLASFEHFVLRANYATA